MAIINPTAETLPTTLQDDEYLEEEILDEPEVTSDKSSSGLFQIAKFKRPRSLKKVSSVSRVQWSPRKTSYLEEEFREAIDQ